MPLNTKRVRAEMIGLSGYLTVTGVNIFKRIDTAWRGHTKPSGVPDDVHRMRLARNPKMLMEDAWSDEQRRHGRLRCEQTRCSYN